MVDRTIIFRIVRLISSSPVMRSEPETLRSCYLAPIGLIIDLPVPALCQSLRLWPTPRRRIFALKNLSITIGCASVTESTDFGSHSGQVKDSKMVLTDSLVNV